MILLPNLLIIAGTGTKSGKTTFACRVIEQFREVGIIAIKISPHFHETTPGLLEMESDNGYAIYIESDPSTNKDTSRMLKAGASRVYLATVWDADLPHVFGKIMDDIPEGTPVVCESPALRNFAEPGQFVIMSSDNPVKRQDLEHLRDFPHKMLSLEELRGIKRIPVEFSNGKWESALSF
jgi:hypothetical protein